MALGAGGGHDGCLYFLRAEDQALAAELARDLTARGFSVWWDTQLLGSDDFYEVILAALNNARAAIVIWTRASAKSSFVRDEARFALHKKKLVACKAADLDIYDIPFGFQGQHTEIVSDREKIVRAVEKLGAKAVVPAPVAPQANIPAQAGAAPDVSAWETVKNVNSPELLLAFLEKFPESAHRGAALQRVRQLVAEGPLKTNEQKSLGFLRMSNWSAFLSGLSLRVPEFQLSAQGTWTSIGLAIGIFALLIGGFFLSIFVNNELHAQGWLSNSRLFLTALIMIVFALFGWRQCNFWVKQRNFIAATVVALGSGLLLASSAVVIGVASDTFHSIDSAGQAGSAAIGGVLSLAYFAWLVLRAR